MKSKIIVPLCLAAGALMAVLVMHYPQIKEQVRPSETEELTQAEVGLFLQFEREVKAVRQAVQNGILAEDVEYLVQASSKSLEVFDLLDELTRAFPEAQGLEKTYQDFYAQLVSIISLFMEKRLERGRARLMELEESHSFIDGKMRAIVDSVTGDGCLPCFEDLDL